jgi:hypothetical protein
MLEKLNPLNWFADGPKKENSEQKPPTSVSTSLTERSYRNELTDKSRIENPRSPTDASQYRYTGVHTMSTPLYGYKATNEGIARLIIPTGAKVVSPSSPAPLERKKLRAGEVYVDKIICSRGPSRLVESGSDVAIRNWYEYEVGKVQIPEGGVLSKSVSRKCAPGLHFFLTAGQAIDYYNRNCNGVTMSKTEAVNAITPNG